MWLRIFFVLMFVVAQFFFVLVYMFADLVATLITTHNALVTRIEVDAAPEPKKAEKREAAQVRAHHWIVNLSITQALETLAVLLVLFLPGLLASSYFQWIREVVVFDNTIKGESMVIMLLTYVGLYRAGATLYNDVITPDFTNWIYADAPHLGYSAERNLFILVITRVDFWFRYLLLIQFALSNVYFIIVSAAVDIPLSLVVMARYMRHKDRAWRALSVVQMMSYNMSKIQLMYTNQRAHAERTGVVKRPKSKGSEDETD
jgi:hypothetical protein